MLRLGLAWIHLLALAIGFGAILGRANALKAPLTTATLSRAFRSDTAWGVAAALWITTGLWRLFAQTEKTTSYYMNNHAFWLKMILLALILALEIWPMVTLVRWRVAVARSNPPEGFAVEATARRIAMISRLQAALVLVMVLAAVAMARGYGTQSQ